MTTKQKGFTLLEVMVALLIIAIVLFSLLRITALQANHLQYLEQKIEEIYYRHRYSNRGKRQHLAETHGVRNCLKPQLSPF